MTDQQNRSVPPNPHRDNELYAQIAAGDEIIMNEKNARHNSLTMSVMVWYMRMMLSLDEKRRQYEKSFILINRIWAGFMGALYLSGVAAFAVLVVGYMQLPNMVRSYLAENGIEYSRMDIPGIVKSKIELYDLHDKKNSYKVDKVSISSTFSDFLNHRAKSVKLEGLTLTLTDVNNKNAQEAFLALSKLNTAAKDGIGVRIDNLDVNDAKLSIKGKDYELPVSFSMLGVYGDETTIVTNISINEPYLSLKGKLNIQDKKEMTDWTLDILEGAVSLPSRPQEKLSGKVTFWTKQMKLLNGTANLTMAYDRLKKDIVLDVRRSGNVFDGSFSFTMSDSLNTLRNNEKSNLSFSFSGVSLNDKNILTTSHPIMVSILKQVSGKTTVRDLSTTLNGKLTCQLFEKCQYDLTEPTQVRARMLEFPVLNTVYRNRPAVTWNLLPQNKVLAVSLKTGEVQFNLPVGEFDFKTAPVSGTRVSAIGFKKGGFEGSYNLLTGNAAATVQINNGIFDTAECESSGIMLAMQNFFDPQARITVTAKEMRLRDNRVWKAPFEVYYIREKDKTDLRLLADSQKIHLLFSGALDLATHNVDGYVVIPTVDVEQLTRPLRKLTEVISPNIQNITGKVAAYGRISGNLDSTLNGPMYVALSDVDVQEETLNLKGVNAAFVLKSIYPFVTDDRQKLYIRQINSVVPLDHIQMIVQIEEKYARLYNLQAKLAGVSLSSGELIIPYQRVGTLVYLQNQGLNLNPMATHLKASDWTLKAPLRGTILLPIEVRDNVLSIKNGTLQASAGTVAYTGVAAKSPVFLEKNKAITLRGGSITLDGTSAKPEETKVNLVLETVLEPTKKRTTLRRSWTGNVQQLIQFNEPKDTEMPEEIQRAIQHIHQQTDAFRL